MLNSEQPGVLCSFFNINQYWVMTGEQPTLLHGDGIVGTVAVDLGIAAARLLGIENYSHVIPTRRDPRAGGDSLPTAADIASWLRKNEGLRKEVEKLLAADPPDSQNDNHKG